MKGLIQEFITLALGAVFLYLVLAHYTGAERVISATGGQAANIFKTLQGPPPGPKGGA